MATDLSKTTPGANVNIPTVVGVVGGFEQELVDARTLHESLRVGGMFSHWIKRRISGLGLVEGQHFCKVDRRPNSQSFDYLVLPIVAVRMALMQRSYPGSYSMLLEDLQQQVAFLRERFFLQNPEYEKVVRYLAIDGLSVDERANLMGWTVKQWNHAVEELNAARMLDVSLSQAALA